MPVLSPHRSAASSGLSATYRSSFNSSSLDRPYYGSGTTSSSYNPRYYTERYSSRSYIDSDGRRILSRAGSITEDGVTTRFREETREGSVRRDSLPREGSVLDGGRRESSLSRGGVTDGGLRSDSRLASIHESVADLRNKYSPANYVPAHLRNRESAASSISRSKTLNDIGLPPIESKQQQQAIVKKKVTSSGIGGTVLNLNNSTDVLCEFSNNTNTGDTDNMYNPDDDNCNRPSVSEMRKKFDSGKNAKVSKTSTPAENKIDNRFKKLDERKPKRTATNAETETKISARATPPKMNGHAVTTKIKKAENEEKKIKKDDELKGGSRDLKALSLQETIIIVPIEKKNEAKKVAAAAATEKEAKTNHVNNFASYIPSKDFNEKEEPMVQENVEVNGDGDGSNNIVKIKKVNKDIATSPNRLNRSPLSQNASGTVTTNSIGGGGGGGGGGAATSGRTSVEREMYRLRDFDSVGGGGGGYDRSSPNKQMGLNGLKNIGNTCFMNSVIQCLSNTRLLLEYVRKDGYSTDINTTASSMKGALFKAFAQVIKELWSEDSSDRVVNTVALKSQIQRFAPRFMGYSQQDAQEFLRYLLEGLHEDVNRVTAKPQPIHKEIDESLCDSEKASESWHRYVRRENSKVVDIFVGQLKSTLKCTHCGHCSVTFDPFWDLSLPIPPRVGSGVRLSQCLDSFTREETLDGDEKPTCSKCKERRKCTKSFTIHKFPKILVIHLKRFSPTERYRGKLSVNVDFPLEGLDMSNYAAESHTQCRYNLYAISNHSGTTYSGHYTAYCRHPYSMAWHEYNDSRVSTISPKSIVSGEAYVLFYELDSKMSHL